ncbi:N-alpha-acetyltransferase 50 [Phytophthora nicotianae]|uniref:N-alpha-acetyltransferase 50 n=1 Tax=Phytophthora nicotianae TaxID=4792 RepID=A0A0W8CNU8_PHYNI|nr:N-alpha-acetyltransferase 50 [Phytophthora nicotianae]
MLRQTLQVVGVRVEASKAGKVVKKLQNHLLNLPKLRNVVADPASDAMKLVLLSTRVRSPETLQPLPFLHDINEKLFPVKYNDVFYEYVTDAPEGYCKLGTLSCYGKYSDRGRKLTEFAVAFANDGTAIGTVCCEVEKVRISGKRRYRLCILTIGVLDKYRRSKLGSLLLESVIKQARRDRLAYVYLHVQTCNAAAQRFYLVHGFEVTKLMRNYYSQLNPPHCFVLRKQLS